MVRSLIVQNPPPPRRTSRPPTVSEVQRPPVQRAQMQNPSIEVQVPMDLDGEESSEYETDSDAEPEEHYLSLDLTIPTPIHAGPSSNPHVNAAPPSHIPAPRPLSSTTRSGRTGRRPPPGPSPPAPSSPSSTPVERWAAGDSARIQILDLHTPSPLISFGNRIWSGTWTATVGTEIFVRCPAGPAPEDQEVQRGVYVSQKDTSAAAAAGSAVEVVDVPAVGGEEEEEEGGGEVVATSGVRVHCLPAVLAVRSRGITAQSSERTYGWRPAGKSSFLERLEEIRVAKGEKVVGGVGEGEGAGDGEVGTEKEKEVERRGMGEAFRNRVDGEGSGAGGSFENVHQNFTPAPAPQNPTPQGLTPGVGTGLQQPQQTGSAKGKEKAID